MDRNEALTILELPPTASKEEIRRAYLRMAKLYHPDLNPDPDAVLLFRKVKEAYDATTKAYSYVVPNETEHKSKYSYPKYSRKANDPEYRKKAEEYKKRKQKNDEAFENSIRPLTYIYGQFSFLIHVAGLVFSIFLFTDFLLPTKIEKDIIVDMSSQYQPEGNHRNIIFAIRSIPFVKTYNHSFSPNFEALLVMSVNDTIEIKYSPIFGVVRGYFISKYEFRPAYDIFRNVWLFPVSMAFLSLLGIVYRNNTLELRVNSIFIIGLIIITYLLM